MPRAGAQGLDVSLVLPTFPLGPGPRQAIQDSASWFIDNGYVAASRKALINWDISSGADDPDG